MTFDELKIVLSEGLNKLKPPALQKEWGEVYDKMIVHSRGIKPKRLFQKNFPNEDNRIREYRNDVFEPITRGAFYKGYIMLYRALSESNYSIKAPDYFKEWLQTATVRVHAGGKAYTTPVIQYFFKSVLWRKLEDPNGFLVTLPRWEGMLKPNQRVDVDLKLILSKTIRFINEDLFIWEVPDKNGALSKTNYLGLSDNDYFSLSKAGDVWQIVQLYEHKLGYIPVCVFGGIPTAKTDYTGREDYFFDSDFSTFTAHANSAIINKSIHHGSMITSAFPMKIIEGLNCTEPMCDNGKIWDTDKSTFSKCKTCKGLGKLIPANVYEGIIIADKDNLNPSDRKPLEYVFPPVDIIQISGTESDNDLKKAEEALYLKFIEMAQSGVAKEMDRQDQWGMMFNFSDYFFDVILKQTLNYCLRLVFPEKSKNDEVQIQKPISFRIKDEQVLLNEFKEAILNGLPEGVLMQIYRDFLAKRFSGDELGFKKEELAMMVDPLYILPFDKRQQLLLSGVIDKFRMKQITAIASEIDKLVMEMKGKENDFLAVENIDLVEIIQERLAEMIPVEPEIPELELPLTPAEI